MDQLGLDFSYSSYEKLLKIFTYAEYSSALIGDVNSCKTLYLRHDVDIDYLGAIPLARVEQSLGLYSTWYFLPNSPVYNLLSSTIKKIICELVEMGHQVGLHIDASEYASLDTMKQDLAWYYDYLSPKIPLSQTISFHRPTSWLFENIIIPNWINAYQSEYYSDVVYVSDSNRRKFWKEDRLYSALNENRSLTLLTHPLWWKEKSLTPNKIHSYVRDTLGNTILEEQLGRTCGIFSQE